MLKVGDQAPGFTLRDQHKKKVSLDELKGRKTMLVFMPMAFTSTCQSELCSIRDNLNRLESFDANVVVITCDSVYSNNVWADQQGFSFRILSDFWPHGEVTRAYGCFDERFGVANRATFILDPAGVVREVIATDEGPRDFDAYPVALASI